MLTRNIRRLMLLVMMCCGMAVTNAQTSYNLSITTEGVGAISYTTPTSSGVVDANMSNSFTIYEGEELQLTFTPGSDAYKLVSAIMNSTNIMADMTGNTYTVSSVSGNVTIYGAFDIAIKHGTMQTTVIDGIEWTYTVTDETNKRCQLGAIDSLVNSITAVPTSTVAENLAIPSVINGYTVYGLSVEAFRNCSGLTGQLNIPETVTFIGDQAFQGTNFSGPLTLPSGLNDLCSYSFYNLYNLTGDLVIPESLTVLPAYAFFNCRGFTSLTLPAGVTNLWTRCFGQMYGLKQITCYATTPPTIGAENVFSDYTIPLFVPAESVDAYKAATYWSNFTNIYAIGTVLDHTVTVASSDYGTVSGVVRNLSGASYSEFQVNAGQEVPVTVPVGYNVELSFTANDGAYLYRVMQNDMYDLSDQIVDGKLTLTDVNEDMKLSAEFLRTQLLLQVNSQTTYGTTNWEVTDVLGGGTVTSGTVQNEVQDVPVFYGSTVKVTFTYDQSQYGLSQLLRGTTDILGNLAADGSYTITNYAKTDTITVSFAELPTEAYAALDGNTLTFYYDKQKTARGGMSVGPFASAQQRPWWPSSKNFTNVVFDVSFSDYYPSSTAHWFYEFENLTSITGIEYLKTENVTDMTCMFWGCYALSSLDVSGFNTSNVTSMDHLFTHCSSLTSLDLTNFNTEKVTNMESMFWNCSSLTTLDLSNFNTSNVTNVSSMFADCSSLTTIYVGSGWSMENVTSGDAPFNGCTSLVGGKGTVYDSNLVNYAYAHIDGGPSNPGYFTDINAPTSYDITLKVEGWGTLTAGETNVTIGSEQIVTAATGSSMILAFTPDAGYRLATVMVDSTDVTSQVIADSTGVSYYTLTGIYDAHTVTATFVNNTKEAYAVLTDDDTVVTFYYDTHRGDCSGVVVDIYFNNYPSATTAIFDASFADYLPTSTNSWFMYCSSLTSVTGIQYLKTDNVTDMSQMFQGCSSLTSLDLSSFNTANVTSMHDMFDGCSSLTSIDLSGFNTANVTDMTYMFRGCSGLTSLDLSSFNTANVTSMSHMFYNCSSLTSLDLSTFNTVNVQNMSVMFAGCYSLAAINLGGTFSTTNVTDMESMFSNCSSLTTLDLSNFSTGLVTNMYIMFNHCTNLQTIIVGSNWSIESLSNGGDMFAACNSLVGGKGTSFAETSNTDVNFFTTSNYAHIDGGLSNPGYLTDINAPTSYVVTLKAVGNGTVKTGDTTVSSGGEQDVVVATGSSMILAFTPDAGYRLATVMVDSTDVTSQVIADSTGVSYYTLTGIYDAHTVTATFVNDTKEAYAVLSADNSTLTYYYDTEKESRGGMSVTEISHDGAGFTDNREWADHVNDITRVVFDQSFADYTELTSTACWFAGMSSLVAIEGLEHLNTANVTDMWSMFSGCSALTTLDLKPLNTGNVTDMGWMFAHCSALTSLDLTNLNTAKLTNMHSMFFECSSLSGVDVTNFNTQNVTTMVQVFSRCENLTSLDLRSFNTENVTSMANMFEGCTKLTTVNLSSFNTTNVKGMVGMFANCSALETLDLSSFNTSKVEEIAVMFGSASSLRTIYVGDAWDMSNIRSGYGAEMFRECNALIGGKGTVFDANHTDYTYAHIDGGAANPGYFTDINAPTSYPVTIKAVGHGTVTAGDATVVSGSEQNVDVAPGSSMILAFTPDAGYRLATVMVDSTDVTSQVIADSTGVSYYTLTSIYDDHTVTATFVDATIDVVGNTDFSSAWWTAFSSNYEIPADHTLHMQFTNHSDKANNWDNWVLMCTADSTRTPEYFALRADSYGWGDYYNGDGLSGNWTDWDAFREGMDGALVDLTVRRWGSEVTVTSVAKATDNTEYVQTFTTTIDPAADQPINVFLTVEKAYLEIYKNSITLMPSEAPAAYAVLSSDGQTVTFYYDAQKTVRGGVEINSNNAGTSPYGSATTAVIDASFADYYPTSTAYWFMNCSNLTSIEGMANLNTGNVTDMEYMFYGCSGLTTLDVSGFNTANVTDMGLMFVSCSSLTSLDVSNFNTANVGNMQSMFYDCSGLTSLNVTNFNTANVTNMGGMFGYCSGLTSLDVSNFNTVNVTSMLSMFHNCSSLTSLDLSNFNTANVTNMGEMFRNCSSLTSIDLSDFNTSNVTGMYNMFDGCSGLKTIYVGEGWSTASVTISEDMFADCTALVGGKGTVYDANHTDASYAHIDGGTANPGYLSRILQKGDANGDGEVNIADAVAAVAYILGTGEDYFSTDMADMNDDSEIDIFDVTMIVNAALAANNTGGSRYMAVPSNISRIAAEDIRLTAAANRVSVGVERVEQFTAFQFDVTLPEGTELVGVKLSTGATDHQLSFVKRGDGQYRVVGLSMSNEVCYSPDGNQLQLQLSGATGSDGVRVSNMLFVNPVAKDATGIRQPTAGAAQEGGYYDLNGRYMGTDRQQLNKGMYIKNHKKVIIK